MAASNSARTEIRSSTLRCTSFVSYLADKDLIHRDSPGYQLWCEQRMDSGAELRPLLAG